MITGLFLLPSAVQAGNFTFSWTAAQLIAACGSFCIPSGPNLPVTQIEAKPFLASYTIPAGGAPADWTLSTGDFYAVGDVARWTTATSFLQPSSGTFSLQVSSPSVNLGDTLKIDLLFLDTGKLANVASLTASAVPEPGTYAALLGLGLTGVVVRARIRRSS
jgi:hypothetical protein